MIDKWIKYVQKDIFAIQLKNFVSMQKRTRLLIPNREGSKMMERAKTKAVLP